MPIEPIATISGQGVAILGDDIDTDRIIPARYLRCVTFDGLGEHLMADDRAATREENPHPLDTDAGKNASIMVVDHNFGCGSSREHAPQALQKWGFRVLIGGSFAGIFHNNSTQIGLVCVVLNDVLRRRLVEILTKQSQSPIRLDIHQQSIHVGPPDAPELSAPIDIPAAHRSAFLAGTWDPLSTLLQHQDKIAACAQSLPYPRFIQKA